MGSKFGWAGARSPLPSGRTGVKPTTFCGHPLSLSRLGQSAHALVRRKCLLLSQSGHWLPQVMPLEN
jgi:hypothetical protein